MNKHQHLSEAIAESIKEVSLSVEKMQDKDSGLSWDHFCSDGVGENTDDLYFMLSITGDKFEWKEGKIEATQAEVECEIIIHDCVLNKETNQYTWSKNQSYQLSTDNERVNVALYLNGDQLNETGYDKPMAKGLYVYENINLSDSLCEAIKCNTPTEQMIEVCKLLVSTAG